MFCSFEKTDETILCFQYVWGQTLKIPSVCSLEMRHLEHFFVLLYTILQISVKGTVINQQINHQIQKASSGRADCGAELQSLTCGSLLASQSLGDVVQVTTLFLGQEFVVPRLIIPFLSHQKAGLDGKCQPCQIPSLLTWELIEMEKRQVMQRCSCVWQGWQEQSPAVPHSTFQSPSIKAALWQDREFPPVPPALQEWGHVQTREVPLQMEKHHVSSWPLRLHGS